MKVSEIRIKDMFAATTPKLEKMQKCRDYWNTYHNQEKLIIVDRNGFLVDGYIQYLILKENNVEDAKVKIGKAKKKRVKSPTYREKTTTYIYGTHPNSDNKKQYIWRVPETWNNWVDELQVGDRIFCSTKFGVLPVIVEKIETLDKCPVEFNVKKVGYNKIVKKAYEEFEWS